MEKRHRIFIAINLPADVKRALGAYEKKWPDLPAKWIPQDNLHITLLFLGDLTDLELGEVCTVVKSVAAGYGSLDINFNAIGYGPANKIPPKMIWASGEKSPALSALKKNLESELLGKIHFATEKRGFHLHVTLAKISAFTWRQIEPTERPEVKADIDMIFTFESIEIMESEIKRGRHSYTIIESIML